MGVGWKTHLELRSELRMERMERSGCGWAVPAAGTPGGAGSAGLLAWEAEDEDMAFPSQET